MKRKTNADYVLESKAALGSFARPQEYRRWIYDKYGVVVNPSDVTKNIGSMVDRLKGVPQTLREEAKRYIRKADNNVMLAKMVLRDVIRGIQ